MLLTRQFVVCGGMPSDLDSVMLESTFDCSQAMINTVLHKPCPYILRKMWVFYAYQSLTDVSTIAVKKKKVESCSSHGSAIYSNIQAMVPYFMKCIQ